MVDAFRTHSVVAVTAGHGEARGYAFAQLLIHDPRLIAAINDIVIEEGSARYQDVVDRFRARRQRADRVAPPRVARHDAAGPRLRSRSGRSSSRPCAASTRPCRRRTRFGSCSAIRRSSGRTSRPPEEHRRWIEMRDTFPADLIQREVIAEGTARAADLRRRCISSGRTSTRTTSSKGRRKRLSAASKTSGARRCSRSSPPTSRRCSPTRRPGRRRASRSSAAPCSAPPTSRSTTRPRRWAGFRFEDGKPDFSAPIPRDQWKTLRAEDQFDAVLYTGKGPSPRVDLDPARCAEKTEFQEHLRRMAVAGLPPSETERLKKLCGL